MSAITGVLFDFGGVVIDSPFAAFAEVEARHGLVANAVRDINSRNSDANAWAQLERASVDADRFIELYEHEAAELGHSLDARAILQAVRDVPAAKEHARVEVLRAVEDCRMRGLRVGLLTNNIAPMDSRPEATWVYDVFDVVVESCRLGLRKPDPAIYEHACAALGTRPDATVFLDDLGINLKPARALGLRTIKVVDAATAMRELASLLAAG